MLPTWLFATLIILLLAVIGCQAAMIAAKDFAIFVLRAFGYLPHAPYYGTPRSPKWAVLERDWLKLHPQCAACGQSERVSVHHKRPYHLAPELELDPTNLISLCEKHHCHLMLGHSGDWHAFNPQVEEDARFLRKRIAARKYE